MCKLYDNITVLVCWENNQEILTPATGRGRLPEPRSIWKESQQPSIVLPEAGKEWNEICPRP
jgi:hypothetical protein